MLQNTEDEQQQAFQIWLKYLFDSEINYFEAGSEIIYNPFAKIARMQGLESIAAGCVVQYLQNRGVKENKKQWFNDLETQLREIDCHYSRIYVQDYSIDLDSIFSAAEYRPMDEIALILPISDKSDLDLDLPQVYLREIKSENDWAQKLNLEQQLSKGPDGHETPANLWIEMEQRKVDAGYMTPYFVCFDEHICGAVNLALCDDAARLKNMVIYPQWRRKCIGKKAVTLLVEIARQHGKAAIVCFALHNAPSLTMYQQLGFQVVGRQTEWLKSL